RAGLVARTKQGQCYQEMGDTRRAQGLYGDILLQPDDDDAVRRITTSAKYLMLQCYLDDSLRQYELAVEEGEKWLAGMRGVEDRMPDWLAVRYHTALAHKLMSETTHKDDADAVSKDITKAKGHAN